MSKIKYWLWLSSQTMVSPRSKAALAAHYGDAETAFFAPRGEFASVPGVTPADAEILERRDLRRTDGILADCEAGDIGLLALGDAAYPQRLRHIADPPVLLYIRGKLPLVDELPAVAVIGTRRASPYGVKMGRSIAYEIAKCGGIVISMLSSSVDMAAARGALLAGGGCIGVLGTPHPVYESELARDLVAHGALVSEYPPGTRPMKSFFRDRNRIAAGLSVGVVVTEAPEKSGALLFAAEAQEQGREIFAVPGNADSPNSVGTLELLKNGAKPVACGWDVMEEFAALFPGRVSDAVSAPCPEEAGPGETAAGPEQAAVPKKVIDKEKDTGYIDLTRQLAELSQEQLALISAIEKGGSHIDDIIEATGLGAAKVLSQLTVLEIKGFIRRDAGRRIVLNTAKK